MAADSGEDSLPEELQATHELLRSSFPRGLDDREVYLATLVLLHKAASARGVAHAVSVFTGKPWATVYNDLMGAHSDCPPSEAGLQKALAALTTAGYESWLKAPTTLPDRDDRRGD